MAPLLILQLSQAAERAQKLVTRAKEQEIAAQKELNTARTKLTGAKQKERKAWDALAVCLRLEPRVAPALGLSADIGLVNIGEGGAPGRDGSHRASGPRGLGRLPTNDGGERGERCEQASRAHMYQLMP